MNEQPQQTKRPAKASFHEPPLPKSSMVIWIIGLGLLVFFIWAALFKLEEVSTGTGKVIPSSKEQIIQSLEGGILTKLDVKEGDIVEIIANDVDISGNFRVIGKSITFDSGKYSLSININRQSPILSQFLQ